ncbi:hypothetical protein ACP4OV_018428 [Aristida adscensionis]
MATPAPPPAVEEDRATGTRVGDLPEACLALAIALTSPRDACRAAAVSPAFRVAADSDAVWRRFLPDDLVAPGAAKADGGGWKRAYLRLCDAGNAAHVGGGGGCRVWLEPASGARCYVLPARTLSLPWDDGELSWRWTPHPRSRFGEVAELVGCTSLDIYACLPAAAAAALPPAIPYAAFLVYGTAEAHRGLSLPDQETAVAVAGRVVARHAVCLRPDAAAAAAAAARGFKGAGEGPARRPRRREDGWWEMEMGRLCLAGGGEEEEVTASFEVLGWYPKGGLIVDAVEFRPVAACI